MPFTLAPAIANALHPLVYLIYYWTGIIASSEAVFMALVVVVILPVLVGLFMSMRGDW